MKKVLTVLVVALVALTSVFAAWEIKADFAPSFAYDKETAATKFEKAYNAIAFDLAGKFYVADGFRVGAKAEIEVVTSPTDAKNLFEAFATFGYGYDFGKFDLGADVGFGLAKALEKGVKAVFALDAEIAGAYEIADFMALDFGFGSTFIFEENAKGIELKPFVGLKASF